MKIKASDRTYIRDARGTLRVADYNANGVENSDLYVSRAIDASKTEEVKANDANV